MEREGCCGNVCIEVDRDFWAIIGEYRAGVWIVATKGLDGAGQREREKEIV